MIKLEKNTGDPPSKHGRPASRPGKSTRPRELSHGDPRPRNSASKKVWTTLCWRVLVFCAGLLSAPAIAAGEVLVAVATNFLPAAQAIGTSFAEHSGHKASFASASTGAHFAQIRHGAPFDVFLAADQARPRELVELGLAEAGEQFTYAVGELVLWSRENNALSAGGRETLARGQFRRLALANPALAPYGAAAKEVLQAWALWDTVKSKLVFGQNVGQTHILVATGNAELGFVSRSMLIAGGQSGVGSIYPLQRSEHAPIRQDALLLRRAVGNPAAAAFAAFLRSPPSQEIIRRFGYQVP